MGQLRPTSINMLKNEGNFVLPVRPISDIIVGSLSLPDKKNPGQHELINDLIALLDFLENNVKNLSLNEVHEYIVKHFNVIKQSQDEINRVYYGKSTQIIWLNNGFFIQIRSLYDVFGSSTLSNSAINFGHITEDYTVKLCFWDNVQDQKRQNSDSHQVFIIKEPKKLFNYIDSHSNNVSKEDWLKYLESYNGDIFCYQILDDDLKNDIDIIYSVIKKIYLDCEVLYWESEEYNAISPYGGEDISYFPKSVSHCFMDKIKTICNEIGLDKVISDDQINKLAYEIQIEKGELAYLHDKVETFQKKERLLSLIAEAWEFAKKYNHLIYVVNIQEIEEYSHYLQQRKALKRRIKETLFELDTLKNKKYSKYSWIEKTILRRQEYSKVCFKIAELQKRAETLENNLITLREKHAPLLKDIAEYYGLGRKITKKLSRFFYESEFPTDPKKLEKYYREVKRYLDNNRADVGYIKDLLARLNN